MLQVLHPDSHVSERRYICQLLLNDFLGLEYEAIPYGGDSVAIVEKENPTGRVLALDDTLFQTPERDWLTATSLPKRPIGHWDTSNCALNPLLVSSSLPVIYGSCLKNGGFCEVLPERVHLGIDVFGSCFFMLTRYEEVVNAQRDRFERFPGTESLACGEGFIDRPVVNEYLEVLWAAMRHLWPQLNRRQRGFRAFLTHDVDSPLAVRGQSIRSVLRSTVGDIALRKSVSLARRRLGSLARTRLFGDADSDIANTFDSIMELSELRGLRSAFYFIADRTAGTIDGAYSLDDPWIRQLMRRISNRGHEIGLHGSFNTFRDGPQLRREFTRLLATCDSLGIRQDAWGGRQHWLRWEAPTTWSVWEDAGLAYDSTLAYAQVAGFRCGVCYEYHAFDLAARRRLALVERPLMFMESTLLDRHYMALPHTVAKDEIAKLVRRCQMFAGDFTVLWHNSRLMDPREASLYRSLLELL